MTTKNKMLFIGNLIVFLFVLLVSAAIIYLQSVENARLRDIAENTAVAPVVELTEEQSGSVAAQEKTENTTKEGTRYERLYVDLPSGTKHWGMVVNEEEFSFGTATGSVIHTCNGPNIVEHGLTKLCLYESSLLLELDGAYSIIDTFSYDNIGDEIAFTGISFNEGTGIATTTTNPDAKLLISTNPLDCLWVDGMCLSFTKLSHIIDVETGNIIRPELDAKVFSLTKLTWNDSRTKAVYAIGCPEGCPNELLVGIDVENKTSSVLLTRDDFDELVVLFESITWVDDDTITVTADTIAGRKSKTTDF